jgi:hypothetical protein
MRQCNYCEKLITKKIPVELFDDTKCPPTLVGEYCSRVCATSAAAALEAHRQRSRLVAWPTIQAKGKLPVEW